MRDLERKRAVDRIYYQRNRERKREYARERIKVWRKANPEKCLAMNQRRRALKRGAFVEDVDIKVLYERDAGICQLCKNPVDWDLKWDYFNPSNYKTVDHIIPLSEGGEHSYANTQLAHFRCNDLKEYGQRRKSE